MAPREALRTLSLVLLTTLLAALFMRLFDANGLTLPIAYGGDALLMAAIVKSVTDGDYWPILPKVIPSLGAPFGANWNDFPYTEDTMFIIVGAVAKVTGLFPALNLWVLFGHVLAALSFYLVCRHLRYDWRISFAGALLFGFSHFIFERFLPHVVLGYCWHVPLDLLVCFWVCSKNGLRMRTRRFWIACAVALATGLQNPYWTYMFLQFLTLATLGQIFRYPGNWKKRVAAPLCVLGITGVTFFSMHLDTLIYHMQHGPNISVHRTIAEVGLYALQPVDMIVPAPDHRLKLFADLGKQFSKASLNWNLERNEYIGLMGIFGFFWLCCFEAPRVLGTYLGLQFKAPSIRRLTPIEKSTLTFSLMILWIVLYGCRGGISEIIALLGFRIFRCSCRYAVVINAIVLLFLAQRCSLWAKQHKDVASTLLIFLVMAGCLYEQSPRLRRPVDMREVAQTIQDDRQTVDAIERSLKDLDQRLVFQFPVMEFPEAPAMGIFDGYGNLRPYLFSKTLKFSFGDDTGRNSNAWQYKIAAEAPEKIVSDLRKRGFHAILINRSAYADSAKSMEQSFKRLGLKQIGNPLGLWCAFLIP